MGPKDCIAETAIAVPDAVTVTVMTVGGGSQEERDPPVRDAATSTTAAGGKPKKKKSWKEMSIIEKATAVSDYADGINPHNVGIAMLLMGLMFEDESYCRPSRVSKHLALLGIVMYLMGLVSATFWPKKRKTAKPRYSEEIPSYLIGPARVFTGLVVAIAQFVGVLVYQYTTF